MSNVFQKSLGVVYFIITLLFIILNILFINNDNNTTNRYENFINGNFNTLFAFNCSEGNTITYNINNNERIKFFFHS
jgi:hypothetical protein